MDGGDLSVVGIRRNESKCDREPLDLGGGGRSNDYRA